MSEDHIFDEEEIITEIGKQDYVLFNLIESKLESTIKDLSPSDALSFIVNGRTIRPTASKEYGGILLAFLKGNNYKYNTVDSYVTPKAISATEEAISDFYTSDEISEVISEKIIDQLNTNDAVKKSINSTLVENASHLRKEVKFTASDEVTSSVAVEAANAATEQIYSFLQTSSGQAVIASIAQALSTASGQLILKKLIVTVVKKVAGSAMIKSTIMATLKKVSLGALMKTAIGKAIIAVFAMFGIASVPAVWIILPLLVGFLAYEYNKFPRKLSKKVPPEVVSALRSKYQEINKNIVSSILENTWTLLQRELTKPRKI